MENSNKLSKQKPSDILNRYRVFPRLFSFLFVYFFYVTSSWFLGLEAPTPEQAAFASSMLATAAAFFKFYVNSGCSHPNE